MSAFEHLQQSGWPPARLAGSLGESIQTVSNWKQRGIPASKAKAIESLTGVSVKLLRPDDWADYWPDCGEPPVMERRSADRLLQDELNRQ